MKKNIFIFILFLFSFGIIYKSIATEQEKLVTFIYINGSNDQAAQNRIEFKESFTKDVAKMHPQMLERFEKSKLVENTFIKNKNLRINPEPIVFYWGERSLARVQKLDEELNSAKKYTPKVAQTVRNIFAHCLHDAIWVQKYQNMAPIIDDLHLVVKSELDKGNKVVLLGYSAGSFITYQYFLNKFNLIIPNELNKKQNNPEIQKIISENPIKATCLDALLESNIVTIDPYGKFSLNEDIENFKLKYPQLPQKTEQVCFKQDEVKGVINFASPLLLFYSDTVDETTDLNFLALLMAKKIVENDIFFLTVNYRNDPLGFPNSQNITFDNLKKTNPLMERYLKKGNGFIYNKSNLYVPRSFVTAHMAYWDTPKRFTNGVIDAFIEGYEKFYDIEIDKKNK